jgi:hypothetical protein
MIHSCLQNFSVRNELLYFLKEMCRLLPLMIDVLAVFDAHSYLEEFTQPVLGAHRGIVFNNLGSLPIIAGALSASCVVSSHLLECFFS